MAVAILIALAGALAARGATGQAAAGPTLEITPIHAAFIPADLMTQYSIQRTHHGPPRPVTVSWSLTLELVDKAGVKSPGAPDSGAAVDLGCTNAGVGIPKPEVEKVEVGQGTPKFFWHHPDAAASQPPGRYHCNHEDMGPHGHQGLIRVTVSDGRWSCTATYKGTNSSTVESTKDGTASEPTCRPVG